MNLHRITLFRSIRMGTFIVKINFSRSTCDRPIPGKSPPVIFSTYTCTYQNIEWRNVRLVFDTSQFENLIMLIPYTPLANKVPSSPTMSSPPSNLQEREWPYHAFVCTPLQTDLSSSTPTGLRLYFGCFVGPRDPGRPFTQGHYE